MARQSHSSPAAETVPVAVLFFVHEGRRSAPHGSGYRSDLVLDGNKPPVPVEFTETASGSIGTWIHAKVQAADGDVRALKPGTRFSIREGDKTVAAGVVLQPEDTDLD